MNFITRSVHMMWRLMGSWPGNICCATLWLMITTGSPPRRSLSSKSRPATIGTPRAAKNPGETTRNCARGSSSRTAFTWPSPENAKPAAGATGDAHSAASESESLRSAGGWQARDKRQENGGEDGESGADPKHAGVNGEVERANGEARGVASQNGDHRTRTEDAKNRAGAAEQKALGEESATQGSAACAQCGTDG